MVAPAALLSAWGGKVVVVVGGWLRCWLGVGWKRRRVIQRGTQSATLALALLALLLAISPALTPPTPGHPHLHAVPSWLYPGA